MSNKINQIKIMKKDGNVEMKNVILENADYRASIVKIMAGQTKAQENMVSILRSFFEMNGIATPSFSNKDFCKLLKPFSNPTFVEEWSNSVLNKDPIALKQLETMYGWMDFILTADDKEIERYNKETIETEKQGVFIQCLTMLSHLNNIDRLGQISMLMDASIKTTHEIEKQRCWALATMLMIPEIAA